MVRRTANGMARKTSPTSISQKWINQERSMVGTNDLLVGSVNKSTLRILPMWTKPVKKMTVRGVP
jgi:hypothetical protein